MGFFKFFTSKQKAGKYRSDLKNNKDNLTANEIGYRNGYLKKYDEDVTILKAKEAKANGTYADFKKSQAEFRKQKAKKRATYAVKKG